MLLVSLKGWRAQRKAASYFKTYNSAERIESMMKKIYVAEYKGMYKIGVSVNTERRMKQLSCGCPGIVCIYESPFLDKFYQVEHKLHNIFKSYCIGGEWFSKVDFQIIENTVRIEGSA
ncbi:MAG TPA: GIY-YIG nuclease family protein, partial [Candidatus Limivivens merdigallinarum]|nr:GIY-YIG nuclease family protein [Candidatus Limivivens merdigallinarum]